MGQAGKPMKRTPLDKMESLNGLIAKQWCDRCDARLNSPTHLVCALTEPRNVRHTFQESA